MEYQILNCPHCNQIIQIYNTEFNCKIFRCGIYKKDFNQIHPHLNKNQCDYLKDNNLIYGCGRPFEIVENENEGYKLRDCGYI